MKAKLSVILIIIAIMIVSFITNAQSLKELSKNGIDNGILRYYENFTDSISGEARFELLSNSRFKLMNKTRDLVIDVAPTVKIDYDVKIIAVTFKDEVIKNMTDCDFVLYMDDFIFAATDSSPAREQQFTVDVKPTLDMTEAQKLDLNWYRSLFISSINGNLEFKIKGSLSTQPDSSSLNSIQVRSGYTLLFGNVGVFKYVGLSGRIGSEHPQDFSQTNLVGDIVISTILPFTDRLARFVTNNQSDASIGLLVQPAFELVKNTTAADSSYYRGAVHVNWNIPLMSEQYANIYGVAYFQDGFRPRSYLEITINQNIMKSFAVIAKWVNGELPPLFNREVDLRFGIRYE